jgi:hypothetical protein
MFMISKKEQNFFEKKSDNYFEQKIPSFCFVLCVQNDFIIQSALV